jgi:hypothetical protein
VKVLYITGYPVDPAQPLRHARPGSAVLQKPFTAEQLSAAVQRILAL